MNEMGVGLSVVRETSTFVWDALMDNDNEAQSLRNYISILTRTK